MVHLLHLYRSRYIYLLIGGEDIRTSIAHHGPDIRMLFRPPPILPPGQSLGPCRATQANYYIQVINSF